MKSQYSDEMINAFVDDELDRRDRDTIKKAMETDAELCQRVMSVCALKKSIKQSYSGISFKASRANNETVIDRYFSWQHAFAALLLLCLGLTVGWYGGVINQNRVQANMIQGLKLAPVNLQQPNRIVLHVASSEGDTLQKTMQKLEYIIDQYQANHLPFEMEIIANSGGIDLLRQDVSPYRDRIVSIMNNYENISFVACSNAIDKLRSQGIEPRFIADTRTGETAIEQIVKRLQEGWVYVKV